jgi:hypothetical protein
MFRAFYVMALWDVRVWAGAAGIVHELEVLDDHIVQSCFDDTVSVQYDFPVGAECGPYMEVAVTKAEVFGVTRCESVSHFGDGSGENVGQIVHQNNVGLGPCRRQVDCILEGISFLLVKVLQATRDKQFNIFVVNFVIPHVQQELSALGFVLP